MRFGLIAWALLIGWCGTPASAQVLFVTNYNNGQILQFDAATGAPLASPPQFNFGGGNADGMHFDAMGRLHVATTDTGGTARIRRFNADFSGPTTLASTTGPTFLDQASNGSFIYQASFDRIYRSSVDGSGFAEFYNPGHATDGVRIGPDGHLYVVNAGNGHITRYNLSTNTPEPFLSGSVIAGLASQMEFGPDGRVYISRTVAGEARIYRYSLNVPGNLASGLNAASEQLFGSMLGGTATGIRFGPDQLLYANNFGSSSVWRSSPVDAPVPSMSLFIASGVGGLDGPGSLIIAVPEPTSLALTGLVGVGLLRCRRRRD